jgi:hypothetical protein
MAWKITHKHRDPTYRVQGLIEEETYEALKRYMRSERIPKEATAVSQLLAQALAAYRPAPTKAAKA